MNITTFLDQDWEKRDVIFEDHTWRHSIPSKPGWYFIKTNMPPEQLGNVESPSDSSHRYNIPQRVKDSFVLNEFKVRILPKEDPFYVVYFGETADLKARAREHVSGHDKTACLALGKYSSTSHYKWIFCFLECPFGSDSKTTKLVRILGEQVWRVNNGWPILCRR